MDDLNLSMVYLLSQNEAEQSPFKNFCKALMIRTSLPIPVPLQPHWLLSVLCKHFMHSDLRHFALTVFISGKLVPRYSEWPPPPHPVGPFITEVFCVSLILSCKQVPLFYFNPHFYPAVFFSTARPTCRGRGVSLWIVTKCVVRMILA